MPIQQVDPERCTGCGNCFDVCPMDVFRMDESVNKAYAAYPQDCTVCYFCEKECPADAVILTPEAAEKMIFPFG